MKKFVLTVFHLTVYFFVWAHIEIFIWVVQFINLLEKELNLLRNLIHRSTDD